MHVDEPGSGSLQFEPEEEELFQYSTRADVEKIFTDKKITDYVFAVLYKDDKKNNMIAIQGYATPLHYPVVITQDRKYFYEMTKDNIDECLHLADLLFILKKIKSTSIMDIYVGKEKKSIDTIISDLRHTHEYFDFTAPRSCDVHPDDVDNDTQCKKCFKFKCCIKAKKPGEEAHMKYLKYKQKYLQLKKQLKL